jgi:hypothetical protein
LCSGLYSKTHFFLLDFILFRETSEILKVVTEAKKEKSEVIIMFDYKPERSNEVLTFDEIGSVSSEFEAFKPYPKYSWEKGKRNPPKSKDVWKIVVPKTAPRIGQLPQIIENMMKMTWKYSEPSAGAQRGNVIMGMRGGIAPSFVQNQTYHSQVRPTKPAIYTTLPNNSAIASDWKVFQQIERTNAVTFRGDSRPPQVVINQCNGFNPPITRTDRYYLENNIFDHFQYYLQNRYQRPLAKSDFLRAIDSVVPTEEDKKLLVDYMMWRKITEREAVHLGRMVEQECLKGYISTARAIDSAVMFGTRYNHQTGWVYLTIVHGGFVVPWEKTAIWGSEEAEIAQWGPIPAERIVGFARFTARGFLDSSIYIRRSFRKSEPDAFETMFKVFSGKTP